MISPADNTAPPVGQHPAARAPIKFLSGRHFCGCNLYHHASVLLREVDFGIFSGVTIAPAGAGFAPAFIERFTGLPSSIPRNGLKEDFIARLQTGREVGFEELLLEAILAVETALAFAMHELYAIAYAHITKYDNHTFLVWSSERRDISQRASDTALLGILELLPESFGFAPAGQETFARAFKKLQGMGRERYSLSSTTAVLKLAAQKRGIPCETVGHQHLMLGQGNRQQHFFSSMTGTTSVPALMLSTNHQVTLQRLAELRLPVPRQIKARTLKGVRTAVRKIGFPLVIKAQQDSKGDALDTVLTAEEEIVPAFERARQAGTVVVETFQPGQEHRLLVIGGKFVAAAIRKPAFVTGDGQTSVAQLLERFNADPVRDNFRLYQVKKNEALEQMLERAGLSLADVPAAGREVQLHASARIADGAIPIDITDQVHPDNRAIAERAANGVGLDVAGIDFLTPDITRSYRDCDDRDRDRKTDGVITAVHARPDFRIHTWPKQGKPRDVAGEVLKLFYPPETNGRIPIVAIGGDKSTGATARVLDMILRGAGRPVGTALRDRAFINGMTAELSAAQQKQAARFLLRDPQVGTLVSTVSPRQAAKRGLLFETCTVSVIMDKRLEMDTHLFHLGLDMLARATTDCFVVSAGNTVALSRLRKAGAKRLILVSDQPNDPALETHLNAGHTGVTTLWQHGKMHIVVFSGTELEASVKAMARGSRDRRSKATRMKNGTMFAIGAAIGLGFSGTKLKQAFKNAPEMIPEMTDS